jgi:hypothetical protein
VRSPKLEQRDFQNNLKKRFGKRIAQFLSTPCSYCRKERFFSAIDYYFGKEQKCIHCQVTSKIIWPMIAIIFRRLSISRLTAKK